MSLMCVRRVVLLAVATIVVPTIFMGLMTMPSKGAAVASKNGVVDLEALMKKVLKLNQQNKHQEAMDALMTALEKNQDDSLLRSLLVQTFEMFLEDEIRFGQQAIEKNKRNTSAYIRVAGALEFMGDNFKALETLIKGISLNPNAPDLWMKIGKLELLESRANEALAIFKEVIRLNPKSSDAYNNAAFVISQDETSNSDDLKLAESYAQMATKIDPKNPDYLDTLAEISYKKGDHSRAKSLIQEAIKLAPDKDSFKDQLKKYTHREPVLSQ